MCLQRTCAVLQIRQHVASIDEVQRPHHARRLLTTLVDLAEQTGSWAAVLKLPFNAPEEAELASLLRDPHRPSAAAKLPLMLLQRGRLAEALVAAATLPPGTLLQLGAPRTAQRSTLYKMTCSYSSVSSCSPHGTPGTRLAIRTNVLSLSQIGMCAASGSDATGDLSRALNAAAGLMPVAQQALHVHGAEGSGPMLSLSRVQSLHSGAAQDVIQHAPRCATSEDRGPAYPHAVPVMPLAPATVQVVR